MAYPVRDGKGVTYIKDTDNVWKPLRGLWQKTDASTWTPIIRANLKVDGTTWESVYPAPQAYLAPSPSSLTFTPFQYHTEPDNDLDGNVDTAPTSVTLQNTGDDDLIIQSITVNNAAGYSVATTHTSLPFTILKTQSSTLGVRVTGLTVGSYSGNIQIQANIGVLGNVVTTIPLSVTVRPDYSDISIRPYPINFVKYTTESAPPQTITVTNTGNGANLIITSNTIANGYVTRSNLPAQIGYNFSTFSGNSSTFTMTAANLAEGSYTDTLTVYNNSGNRPSYEVPINISVITPRGLREFSTPGTYSWTVPDYVHQINLLTVGAGGGGGPGIAGVLEGGSGGGGGSGGYQYSTNVAVTPGETLTVVVGAGGGNKNRPIAIYHPVSLSYAWSGFMNSYAVWTHPDGVTPTNQTVRSTRIFTAPEAGYYTFLAQADNYLEILVDNTPVTVYGDFTTSVTVNVYLNQGSHSLTFNAVNYGGPAGFAVVIQDTNGNQLWNTRTLLDPSGGDTGETTTVTGSFGTVSVAGGLGGGAAYNSGVSYGGGDGGTGSGGDVGQDAGGGGGGGCFLPHTLITMANGTEKRISQIHAGDYVLEALTNKPAKVIGVKTRAHDVTKWVFSIHDNDTPYMTEEHPWYNDNNELCAISTLCSEQAPWLGGIKIVDVKNKIKLAQDVIVYNLMLETGESHYANGVRVNNIVKTGGAWTLVYKGLMDKSTYESWVYNPRNQQMPAHVQRAFFNSLYTITKYVLENNTVTSRAVGKAVAWGIKNQSRIERPLVWWLNSGIRNYIVKKLFKR